MPHVVACEKIASILTWDCCISMKLKKTNEMWHSDAGHIERYHICIWSRTTSERGRGLIWKRWMNEKLDMCCSDGHKRKLRFEAHTWKCLQFVCSLNIVQFPMQFAKTNFLLLTIHHSSDRDNIWIVSHNANPISWKHFKYLTLWTPPRLINFIKKQKNKKIKTKSSN